MDYLNRAETERRNAETRRLNRLRSQRLRANGHGQRQAAETFVLSAAVVALFPAIAIAVSLWAVYRFVR
jgi:hypothetical protein